MKKSFPKLICTRTLPPALVPSALSTSPLRLPLVSRTEGNWSSTFRTTGSTWVVRPLADTTTGKNGLAACRPQSPMKATPLKAKVPRAGSLSISDLMRRVGSPLGLGPTPVKRTFAPMGTLCPFFTTPEMVAFGRKRTGTTTVSPSKRSGTSSTNPQLVGLNFSPSPFRNGLLAPVKAAKAALIAVSI